MSTAQWTNIGEDAGALYALIQRIPDVVPVAGIDYLWIFPPRRVATGESTVVVVGAFDREERRRIITALFNVARSRRGIATVSARFDEHGAAPVDAVPRIVQGVLRRLGEDTAAEPRDVLIDGQQSRWDALVTDLGGRPVTAEPAQPDAPADHAARAGELMGDHPARDPESVPAPGHAAGPDPSPAEPRAVPPMDRADAATTP